MKRAPMKRHHSRKLFTKAAQRVHKKNSMTTSGPMRGGIRL